MLHLLHGLQEVQAWLGPLEAIFGAPAVAVGFVIAVLRVRRWLIRNDGKTDAAHAEATAAREQAELSVVASKAAAEQSAAAAQEAAVSNDTSRLNSRGLVDLKGKYDDLFGAYLSLLALLRPDPDTEADTDADVETPQFLLPESAFTTGRHRLPTQIIPVTGSQETTT